MLAAWIGRSSRSSRGEAILLAIAIGVILDRRPTARRDPRPDGRGCHHRRRRGPSPSPPGTPHGAASSSSTSRSATPRTSPTSWASASSGSTTTLRVELANTAAHLLLGRTPGSMRRPIDDGGVRRRPRRGGRHGGPRHRRRLGRVPGPRAATARRSSCEPAARRSAGSWSSSRTCPSCAASSRSGPSSSTTCRTSCGHRFRRSASSPRRWPATPTAPATAVPAEDARPDHEDRGRDRPSRPDGQRAARPCPDRERWAARADRRHRHRPGRRGVRGASPALRRAAGPAARRRRPGRTAAGSAATRLGSARSSSTSSTTR